MRSLQLSGAAGAVSKTGLLAALSPRRWLNAQLFVTDYRPVPLQSFLKQARCPACLLQLLPEECGLLAWTCDLDLARPSRRAPLGVSCGNSLRLTPCRV